MRTLNCIAGIIISLALFSSSCFAQQHYSYAEVLAGLGFPTRLVANQDENAHVNPGGVGTTIVINGLFPLNRSFVFSPSFGFLSTNSRVFPPSVYWEHGYDARFQQSELAVDALWKPRGLSKLRIGPGISGAWWVAAEDIDHRPMDYYYDDNRRIVRGQSFMARAVAHLMLRNPAVSGVSMKLIGALPLADVFRLYNTSATGYISLQVGFSMLLN